MKAKTKSLRSPLARAQGLGAARHGTGHWWAQRLTSLALVPLSIYMIWTFVFDVVDYGYPGAFVWLGSPFAALFTILFVAVGFHHAANGLQVVIEDYVHCEKLKLASIIFVKFAAAALALLGTIATVKILFFSVGLSPHA